MSQRLRRPTKLATAILVGAVLAMTGCGSSDISTEDKIDGVDGGAATPAPKESHTENQQPSVDFDLPDDVKVEISNENPKDPAEEAILAAHADILMARQKLFTDREEADKWLSTYFTGEAKQFYGSEVERSHEEGWTLTGTYRYYKREIVTSSGDVAVVEYCEDQSKAFGRDIDTGEVAKTSASPDDYRRYTATLYKDPGGLNIWQMESFDVERGAVECQ
ncbi:hypothetical protein JJV70_03505 [Streptomyces sp. JJ66]|uniref:hypothetical protein n=1 Tax=Streptomyces sp. JJ66 TaxID=2803843 RepID=UPI001C58AFC2|nr:hypothetical protein [Streptomyces sp. JJ66]MBW1601183.1 hypothetical protein [Streptomyces sp. JJ66]